MAAAPDFTHLHVHSEYSMLDGLSRVPDLIRTTKQQGMRAIALTDHGVMFGAIEFYEEARQHGINPIVGVEAYVAPRKLTDKESADRSAAHLVLLAKNEAGYKNLLKLTSIAHLEGFYYRPRIDHEALAQHKEGLIALSACASGEVPWALRHEEYDKARKAAEFYRDLFGAEDFYLELQNHQIDFQAPVNKGVIQLARELELKLVATNDSHYTTKQDCDAQDLLLCVQTNTLVDDPKRLKVYTGEHYLKTPEEMWALFGNETPDALLNTMEIAEKCNVEIKFGRLDFPKLEFVPEGESPMDYLSRVCWEALPQKYAVVTPEIEERLRYELDVVRTTGFASYMLFVWDFVSFARKQGIMCGPRGSAAGALILYCLGITTIDPIAHDLTFERFLNPERIQMPDIDMDFADTRREEVIEYVAQRYGRDHVAQICTFGRLLARAAIRDAGRALAYPLSEVDRIAKLVPTIPVGMTIDKALAASPEFKQAYQDQEHIRRLVDAARSIEGVARHCSTHAAGVVVSGEPLVNHLPLMRAARGENVIMSMYEAHALEHIGLLKMDFLGLTNLTLLENALALIKQTRGLNIDLQNIPWDDQKTFEMLSNADTTGVFQLEGAGMRRTLRDFRPTSVDHLAAIVALYRPGPMAHIPTYIAGKDGRRPVTYLHPSLEPILQVSYGVIVYQDQVLQIVRAIAGYSLGQADILRRAMGKKIAEEMRREKDNFLKGAKQNGVEPAVAAKIWEYIEPFAGYAFNRAHAYCYAYIAYQTAYLKCNFPSEYMAAMLSTQGDDTEKVIAAAGECRRLGISLQAPEVNRSDVSFSVVGTNGDQAVLFGLGAIKNVGEGAAKLIIAERQKAGAFKSLDDLCERVDLRTVNKRVLEALTKAGALDDFGPRERVFAAIDRAIAAAQQVQKAAGVGQQSLFGGEMAATGNIALPSVSLISDQQRLAWEKESLGFFLSNHPFERAARHLAAKVTANSSQITEELKGERVTVAGCVMSVRKVITKRSETMCIAHIEDLHGSIEVVVFPRTYQITADLWKEDTIVVVSGKVDLRQGGSGDEESRGTAEVLADFAEEWVHNGEPEPEEIDEAPVLLEDPTSELDDWSLAEIEPALETPPDFGVSEPTAEYAVSLPAQSMGAAVDSASPRDEPWVAATSAPATIELSRAQEPGAVTTVKTAVLTSAAIATADVEAVSPTREPLATTPASAETTCRRVTIVFHESSDRTADLDRLRKLHATLSNCPGEVPYVLALVGSAGRRDIAGPDLRVQYTVELAQDVEALLGPGSIVTEN